MGDTWAVSMLGILRFTFSILSSMSTVWCFSLHSGAGTGGLGLAVEGPSEAQMSCVDNKDGSCSVEYIPFQPGTYNLNITYGGQPVSGQSVFWVCSTLLRAFRKTYRTYQHIQVHMYLDRDTFSFFFCSVLQQTNS